MRLKIVISFIESIFNVLAFVAILAIIGCFSWLNGATIVIAILSILILVGIILSFKGRIINFYLGKCRYPNEFLSVLEQLDLMKDLEISWSNDGAKNSNHLTTQFLTDNNLATEFGKKKISIPFAIIMIVGSFGGIVYVTEYTKTENTKSLIPLLIINLALGLFLFFRGKKQQNDNEPILLFSEKEFLLGEDKIAWKRINFWKYKPGSNDTMGYIEINYQNGNNENHDLKAELDQLNIDRIDFLLLMAHFKTKYGSEVIA